MIVDESNLLISGTVIFDCTNSVVLRSEAMTVAQQDLSHELVTCSVTGFDSSEHAAHMRDDPAFIIGHEAMTTGTPTLNTPKITVRTRARTRYLGLVVIWVL
jgi:hypothetical protein